MNDNSKWTNQETFALLWLLTAITLAIGFSLWQGFSIPIFTLLFLILPLLNLILRKDAQNLGLGKVRIGKLFKWAGINLGALILVYAIFEPWSGAYAFLLEEATGQGATDPTFSWLRLVDGLGGWIGLFFFSGLVTIFAEELFFRGWVLNHLKPRVGSVWANVIQAALFTLPQLVVAFIMPTPMMGLVYGLVYAFGAIGLVNGWVASKSGTIWPNLIAATIMNFILSILILGPA
jgi:membrane protease YdiL (CAAX protease family)